MASETKLEENAAFMDLYSRQIGAYGMETMAKLVQVRALIVGLKGVGIETAKNLILAGPKQVTLVDNQAAEPIHQGGNFYIADEDLGRPIAECCYSKLSELNSGVYLKIETELSYDLVKQHDIVIFTEGDKATLLKWNNFCRSQTKEVKTSRGDTRTVPAPIAFISAVNFGATCSVFSDFGPSFTVRDANGEQPVTRIISNITTSEDGIVELLGSHEGGKRADVDDNDHDGWIEFSEVKGMFAVDEATHRSVGLNINQSGAWRAHAVYRKRVDPKTGKERNVFDPYALRIGDTTHLSPYNGGGMITQVKKPVTKSYRSLSQNILNPGQLPFTDGAKWGRGAQLHLAYQAVYTFQEENERLPAANSDEDAAAVVAHAKAINDAAKLINKTSGDGAALVVEEVDEAVVTKVALFAEAQLQPIGCFVGGIVAQEVVKLAGKYTPIDQFLYLDFFEVLPNERATDTAPLGSRYDNNIKVFGKAFQDKIGAASTFLVGCGALGCEFLKNFALLGLGAAGGTVHTTDNDNVEVSNLNRQFLFRPSNVGQQKSVASADAARAMNPAINIKAYEKLVWQKTEDFFNDKFWESLTFVTNALDNVKARQYVDTRCVFYEKPLLESGTLGTKCNSQVVVPHLTQSYNDGPKDAEDENEIPMCTLRNFPSLIDHCIEWARAQFTDRFVQPATDASKYVTDRDAWVAGIRKEVSGSRSKSSAIASALPKLRAVKVMLDAAEDCSWEKVVRMAQTQFCENFRDRIQNLILAYPEDHTNADGDPFWSGAKRFPQVANLDLANEAHMNFVIATANILACNFGLRPQPEEEGGPVPPTHDWRNPARIKAILAAAPPVPFKRSDSSVQIDEDSKEEAGDKEKAEFKELLEHLATRDVSDVTLFPADFEKDHDWNFHIDFITAASNLRAWNYHIPQATRHKCKMIAGKIIPAIATTTASVTGLVMIEMLKVLQGKDKIEDYRCSSNSLAINSYLMMEPGAPVRAKKEYSVIELEEVTPKPDGFTKWDKTLISKGDISLTEFMAAFKEQTGLNITSVYHACATDEDEDYSGQFLYPCEDEDQEEANMAKPLREYATELYEGANILPPARTYIPLEVGCADDDDNCYSVPAVIFKFA